MNNLIKSVIGSVSHLMKNSSCGLSNDFTQIRPRLYVKSTALLLVLIIFLCNYISLERLFLRINSDCRLRKSCSSWSQSICWTDPSLCHCKPEGLLRNTGAPQRTDFATFKFIFSDDSAVVGCIRDGQEEKYREVVNNF